MWLLGGWEIWEGTKEVSIDVARDMHGVAWGDFDVKTVNHYL